MHLLQDLSPDTDPAHFHSRRTGRGPLSADWSRHHEPMMCCYKLVSANFKWFGLQSKVERSLHKAYPRLFTKFHREIFCWLDRWHGLTLDEVRFWPVNIRKDGSAAWVEEKIAQMVGLRL